ncbi:MAG: response regulator, partial [Desulfamplus sp.]|nr:response regulator [Desulfamplus sp.]
VDALCTKDYHLVLMDMQMPEMDGIEATQIIRNPDSGLLNPQIPIIAMTANTTKEDHQKCLDAGMNDFISKPVEPDQLVVAIRRQVDVSIPEVIEKIISKVKDEASDVIKKVFDREDFLNRIGGNEALLKKFIPTFPDILFEEISKLKSASDRKDAGDIRLHAHTIKGTCANFSAERLSDIAFRIEESEKEGLIDTAASLIDKMEQEAMELKSVLSEMFPDIFKTTDEPEILSGELPAPEMIFPPDAELKTLYELATFGRVLQIEKFTTQLKAMDARYSAFADKVSSMAASFKDDEIVRLIQSHSDMNKK